MKIKKNYVLLIILTLVFLSIFILNQKTLYVSDDILYNFEFIPGMSYEADLKPVDGLFSLIRSQYHHYSVWNGRFVSHFIIQFFMQFDKVFFNIANSIVYVFLGLLILNIAMYITNKKLSIISLIVIYILLFLSIPNFGQTVLWISGSGNYLWMSLIYLGFYFFNIIDKKENWKAILISIIFGFLAGATNENTGPATILMIVLLAVYQFFKEKKIDISKITGTLSSLIGFSMILFSPAASKRVEDRNEVHMTMEAIIENMESITHYIIENHLIYFAVILILLLILFKNNQLSEKIILNIIVLAIGYLGATYSLAAIDGIIERTMFGSVVFLITITIILLIELIEYIGDFKSLISSLIPMILLFSYVYNFAYTDIKYTYGEVVEQYEILLNNPNEEVRVPMITVPESDYNAYMKGTNYLKEDKDDWFNKWASKFFGVESIEGFHK